MRHFRKMRTCAITVILNFHSYETRVGIVTYNILSMIITSPFTTELYIYHYYILPFFLFIIHYYLSVRVSDFYS